MKSTGEVMGSGATFADALARAFAGAKFTVPANGGTAYISVDEHTLSETVPLAKHLQAAGYTICAGHDTAMFLAGAGIKAPLCTDPLTAIKSGKLTIVISTDPGEDAEAIALREQAIVHKIPLFTCLDTINAFLIALSDAPTMVTKH
jgi:carbamoyl-phosphate synthase large subunit